MNKVQLFQDRILTDAEQLALATGAAAYRWEDLRKAPVSPSPPIPPDPPVMRTTLPATLKSGAIAMSKYRQSFAATTDCLSKATRTSLVLLYSAKGFHQLPLTNHSSPAFTAAAVLPPEPLAALSELIEHPS
jgi:hypothetical protein